ncbi:MAG: M48 family metalloprotease, partial [Firmicutes bacterium]|nr:M48 family metalloprotease [Bacillota bacterium]
VESQYGLMDNAQQQERVARIGAELVRFAERKVPYSFKIVKMSEENAFALPGGPIYITQGLIESGINDDALAGILGHEITHIEKKHFDKEYTRAQQEELASLAILIVTKGEAANTLKYVQLVNELVFHPRYSRDEEREADRGGIDIMIKDGRNPYELVKLFEQWRDSGKNPSWIPDFMRDHPSYDERIQIMRDEIAKQGYVR